MRNFIFGALAGGVFVVAVTLLVWFYGAFETTFYVGNRSGSDVTLKLMDASGEILWSGRLPDGAYAQRKVLKFAEGDIRIEYSTEFGQDSCAGMYATPHLGGIHAYILQGDRACTFTPLYMGPPTPPD